MAHAPCHDHDIAASQPGRTSNWGGHWDNLFPAGSPQLLPRGSNTLQSCRLQPAFMEELRDVGAFPSFKSGAGRWQCGLRTSGQSSSVNVRKCLRILSITNQQALGINLLTRACRLHGFFTSFPWGNTAMMGRGKDNTHAALHPAFSEWLWGSGNAGVSFTLSRVLGSPGVLQHSKTQH